MPLGFQLDTATVNQFEGDVWASQQNQKIADDWQSRQLARLNQTYAPDPTPAPQQPPVDQNLPEAQPAPPPPEPAPDAFSAPAPAAITPLPQRFTAPTVLSQPAAPPPSGGFVDYARQAAQRAGIDPDLFVRQINQESGFDPNVGSPAGARGIAQIVPKFHPSVDVTDPLASLDYAANLMKSHLQTYGGDISKALVAYNGGQGAVDALNAGTPYAESQQYLSKILGGGAGAGGAPGAPSATNNLSQFGDQTLTAEEAYAACGPAAAARLAATYGNNIPLSVALQAAKQVGWTADGGMNGIGNQKKLLDALGMPAELDTSGDWGRIVGDASQGHMVTISTPGHYFTASGARPGQNGQTELYVGQSGLDLRGGKAWMTPGEIEARMGKLNGALFTDPSKQVAAGEWLQTASQQHGSPIETPQDVLGHLTTAKQQAGISRPDETVSNPFGEAFRQVGDVAGQVGGAIGATVARVQSPDTGNPVLDALGTGASALGTAVQSVTSPFDPHANEQFPTGGPIAGPGVGTARQVAGFEQLATEDPEYRALQAERDQLLAEQPANAAAAGGADAIARAGRIREVEGRMREIASASDRFATAQRNPDITALENQGAITQALAAAPLVAGEAPLAARAAASVIDPLTGLPSVAGRALEAVRTGPVGEFARSEEGALKLPSIGRGGQGYDPKAVASPELNRLGTMYEPSTAAPPAAAGANPIDSVTGWITQHFTDRDVSLARVQQAYAQALGRPLNADEMVYELKRLAPNPAAEVKIDEGLKPAIQAVGDDYKALRDYVTLRSNVQVADALGNDARLFSGDLTKAASQKALTDLETALGPSRFQTVQTAADQVSQFSSDLRQRLVDSGVLSAQQAADMEAKYPDWVKTRILDYMKDPASGQGAGTKIGLSSKNVHAYTQAGTIKAREDPLASTAAYAHQVEQMAMKNETFNALRTIDQAGPNPMLRQVAQDFTPTRNQVTIVGFENGQKVKYVTDNKALGEAINGTSILPVPEWTKAWGQVFRSLATSRNPLFLAGNAALDIPTYVIRESVRAGGPTPRNMANILGELAKGYVDAFGGLLQNEFRGNTARLIKGGGGSGSYAVASEQQAARSIADLQRRNVFQINGKADLLRLGKDLATLQPVESIGQRLEYGPRTASFRLAEKRGANPVQTVINGRTVTVDFSQGGDVTKYINNFVPFFNVGFQGPAQVARAFNENRGAFAWTVGSLLGAPAIAAEAWNRSDPQRAQDYKDVPQYVKDQGVVVMLPGQTPVDAQGNRKPLYAVLKLREWAPFASLARDAADRVLGDDTKGWQSIAGSAARGFSPTQASSVGQLGTETLSGIPVLPAAAELQYNKDFFRNRDIVTQRADDNASAASKALVPAIQAAVDRLGINAEVRPSAVEFFIRNQGAGVGAAALGASDLVAGKARQDTSPTSLPVVGGLAGRFVGSQTGEQMQNARDQVLSPGARQILRENGITTTPGPVGSSVNQIPLKMDEETQYQFLANHYIDEAIHKAVEAPDWGKLNPVGKESRMSNAIQAARDRAGLQVLNTIPAAEKQRRVRTKSTAP